MNRLPLLYIAWFKCDYCGEEYLFQGPLTTQSQVALSFVELEYVNHRTGHIEDWSADLLKKIKEYPNA